MWIHRNAFHSFPDAVINGVFLVPKYDISILRINKKYSFLLLNWIESKHSWNALLRQNRFQQHATAIILINNSECSEERHLFADNCRFTKWIPVQFIPISIIVIEKYFNRRHFKCNYSVLNAFSWHSLNCIPCLLSRIFFSKNSAKSAYYYWCKGRVQSI